MSDTGLTWRKWMGLRLIMWLAMVLIGDDLTKSEARELEALRVRLSIAA